MKGIFKYGSSEFELEGAVNYLDVDFIADFGPFKRGDRVDFLSVQIGGDGQETDSIFIAEWSNDGEPLRTCKATLKIL